LNVSPTPQSKVKIPLQVDNIVHTETNKKRKNKGIVKNDEANKEQEGEGGSHYSPKREVSPKTLQIQHKIHQLEPEAQNEGGYFSPHPLLQLKLDLGYLSPGHQQRKKVLKKRT
jgi:hypothetical protein